jgi:exodeoxyribonuclease V gamma subunit
VLHLHRAERADRLVEALCDLVEKPLEDPLAAEVVSVPTRGVERWLAQRLSTRLGAVPLRGDGVCANFDFPFPGRLIGGAVAAAAGIDAETDPWLPERSVWPLLGVVDECLAEPWLISLAAHFGANEREGDPEWRSRRFTTIRHIADLFDRYGIHRPEMLCAWAATGSGGADTDGYGRPLPGDTAWQAELWRRLRARIAVLSPAERLAQACDRLGTGHAPVDLPHRLSLFGLTRLPVSYVRVLQALSRERDVHLFLLHPSPVLWARIAEATGDRHPRTMRRHDDRTASVARHPLLASWGQDAREMQLLLTTGPEDTPTSDDQRSGEQLTATLLQRIQADIRSDRMPAGAPLPGQDDRRPLLGGGDHSIQVHACHGLSRQVEVMRDAIVHLLSEDPTLEPRDVIVMCPDIETFAPLIHATFGAGDGDDSGGDTSAPPFGTQPPDLRVRLADRSLRQTNSVLGVIGELLDLASARLTAPQVLDLASREPVRRRFGLDDEDLARLDEWVGATGVRWGFDAAHREPFKLGWLEANTWRAGLDRVLLGVAMAEEGQRLVGGVLPLDDVGSGDIDLAGRFAEFIDRLHATVAAFNEPKPLAAWSDALTEAAAALTTTTDGDSWQRIQLQGLVDDAVNEATVAGQVNPAALTLPEIRALLGERLRGRPTRANFRTGHLTICTLVPMRSVPHRVICLLGLDDGVFPRQAARDGDDIIGRDPHIGDRDSRIEDRQLLLDALLAATEHLVVTYAGRDERTNAKRPPAVPVGELLDVIDRTVRLEPPEPGPTTGTGAADGKDLGQGIAPARTRVVVHHPLQPFDGRNFIPGALVSDRVWSFDPVALEGARSLTRQRIVAPPFLSGPLPATRDDLVELDQLVRFVQHPVNAFLRQRLGLTLTDRSDDVGYAVPIELDALEQWGVGQRLLDARLAGTDAQACLDAERARGILPPGALASPVIDRVWPIVESLVQAAESLAGGPDDVGSLEVNVRLPDGRLLVGTVAGVGGKLLRTVTYSRVGAKHRLAGWARFLALSAAHPERQFEAVTIGRSRSGAPRGTQVTVARLAAFAAAADGPGADRSAAAHAPGADRSAAADGPAAVGRNLALRHLAALVELYDRGMREPLPLYCQTSASYVEALAKRRQPDAAARKAWESTWEYDKEDKELSHRLVLGGIRSLDAVLAVPPIDDERGAGWVEGEASRFGRYAHRLWDGLLQSEELIDK